MRDRLAQALFIGIVVGITSLTTNYVLHLSKHKPIKVEAPMPLSAHPISGEFDTGYVLVEVWTRDGDNNKHPHIVRMRRSEYIEWMNPSNE